MIWIEGTPPVEQSDQVEWSDAALKTLKNWERRSEDEKAKGVACLRDYGERCRLLDEMRPELAKKYPDRWIGFTEDRALVVAQSIEGLVEKIQELGERPQFTATKFLRTGTHPVIPG